MVGARSAAPCRSRRRSSSRWRSRWPSRGPGRARRPPSRGPHRSSCSTRRGRCWRGRRSGETRWERAVRQARALAASAGGDDVALATTADGLVEGPTSDTGADRDRARSPRAGRRRRRAPGRAWPAPTPCTSSPTARVARPLDAGVIVHSVFEPAPNVAITAFDARPATAGGDAAAGVPRDRQLRARAAGRAPDASRAARPSCSTSPCDMAAGEAVRQVVPLEPRRRARGCARASSAPTNALAIDDEAVAWIDGRRAVDVTVVSDEPGRAGAAASARSARRADVRRRPATYQPGRDDVVIFDRWLPADAPTRPALCHRAAAGAVAGRRPAPTSSAPRWVGGRRASRRARRRSADARHQARARRTQGRTLTPVARSAKGTPLVSVLDAPRPARSSCSVVRARPIRTSRIAPAFPVLVGNALEWLARPSLRRAAAARAGRAAGEHARGSSAPDGTAGAARARRRPRASRGCRTPGLYLVEAGGSRGVVGVNVGDPDVVESRAHDICRPSVAAPGSAGGAAGRGGSTAVALAFVLRRRRVVDVAAAGHGVRCRITWTAPGALWLLAAVPARLARAPLRPDELQSAPAAAAGGGAVAAARGARAARWRGRSISTGSSRLSVVYLVDVSHSVASRAITDAAARIDALNARRSGPTTPASSRSARDVAVLDDTAALRALARRRSGDRSGGVDRRGGIRSRAGAATRRAPSCAPGHVPRIVLFTDGRATAGDAADAAVTRLAADGIPVFVEPLAPRDLGDTWVDAHPAAGRASRRARSSTVDRRRRQPARRHGARRAASRRHGASRARPSTLAAGRRRAVPLDVTFRDAGRAARSRPRSPCRAIRSPPTTRLTREALVATARRACSTSKARRRARSYLQGALDAAPASTSPCAPPAGLPTAAAGFDPWDAVILSDVARTAISDASMTALGAVGRARRRRPARRRRRGGVRRGRSGRRRRGYRQHRTRAAHAGDVRAQGRARGRAHHRARQVVEHGRRGDGAVQGRGAGGRRRADRRAVGRRPHVQRRVQLGRDAAQRRQEPRRDPRRRSRRSSRAATR